MGIFDKIKKHNMLRQQVKAEKAAQRLEKKAEYAKKLNQRFARQKKAQKQIDKMKKNIAEQRQNKINKVVNILSLGMNKKTHNKRTYKRKVVRKPTQYTGFFSSEQPFFMPKNNKKDNTPFFMPKNNKKDNTPFFMK